MVTRDDVARAAGVSSAVVSYVVNNGPRRVAEPTRRRVLQAIDDLGYRPNRLAGALRGRSSRMIGLLIPRAASEIGSSLTERIEEAAARRGYALMVVVGDDDPAQAQEYAQRFLEHQVGGVLVAASATSDTVATLREGGIPVIAMRHELRDATASVSVDEARGAALAVQHLSTHGHDRIVYLADDRSPSRAAEEGFRAAMSRRRASTGDEWVIPATATLAGGRSVGQRLLRTTRRPEAILAASDAQAIGLAQAIAAAGLRVGRDVAVIGMGGSEIAGYLSPGLTTVASPEPRLAQHAVERLADLLDGRPSPAPSERLAPYLVIRGSCGCPESE